MGLEGIMRSEISQTKKHKYFYDLIYMWSVKKKIIEKEVRLMVTKGTGWGMGNWRKVVKRYEFPVIKEILEMYYTFIFLGSKITTDGDCSHET